MSQFQENATVIRIEQFANNNVRLTLASPLIAAHAKPGQFVMIRAGLSKDPLLRRPFSIHQVSSAGSVQIYFKVVGRGTEILSRVVKGQQISILGPLGRGFQLAAAPAIIVGGGLGIAPMLFLAKEILRMKQNCQEDLIILGVREKNELDHLLDDFRLFGIQMLLATDDGSLGHHGFVTEVMQNTALRPGSHVYACGPEPMMAKVRMISREQGFHCQVSVESVMACGMGACLGCSRPAKNGGYTHVCINGPVYDAEELVWKQ